MKKVLITGGNGDLAQAICRKLQTDGGYEVRTPGKDELNVTDWNSIRKYFEDYVPDILINNAGYVQPQSIRKCDLEKVKKALDINLGGTFYCTAIALEKNPDTQIVNIGSSAATKIHGTWSSYCASKAAVVMATQCWADDGVNAVCISPGRAQTKMRKGLYPDEDQSTLMKPDDFAVIVYYAVKNVYPAGSHMNVNVNNVKELINEAENNYNKD